MSYVVLARKYRPLVFEDMVGQEHVGRTLGNAIRQDRVHHAYLFAGARGLGKTTTARIFAKGLVCEQGPTATPCNTCEQCVAITEGRSVDVLEIDGASNNKVEEIRNLREQVHYLPQTARRKVYIIDEVHMLTTSSFNALLKTLEEPPPHVNFIFATTEPQKVIPTILSRVSRLDFRRVSPEEAIAHLTSILEKEERTVADDGLRLIARAAGGSVRDSLTLLDQVIAFADDPSNISAEETRRVLGQADRARVSELVDAVLDHDADAVVSRFEELVTAGHDLTVLSMQLLEHMRDLTLAKVCKQRSVFKGATESEIAALVEQANKADASTLAQIFDRFSRVVDRLPTSRVPQMLVEMGLLDLAHAEALMPLGDIVQRLEAIGGGGSGGAGPQGGGRGGGGGSFRPPTKRAEQAPAPAMSVAPQSIANAAASFQAPQAASTPPATPAPQAPSPQTTRSQPAPASFQAPTAPATPASPAASEAAPAAEAAPTIQAAPAPASFQAPAPQATATPAPAQAPAPSPVAPKPAPSFGDSELMNGLWNLAKGAVRNDLARPPHAPPASNPASASSTPQAPGDAPEATRCGPCSEPPPNPNAIDLELTPAFEAWEELVSRIRERDDMASAVLSQVGLVAFEGGRLAVCLPKGSFEHVKLTQSPTMRSDLEQAARDHLGRPFTLELIDGTPSLEEHPSIVLVNGYRKEERQREAESEAREHGMIKNVLATFNATLLDTKPLEN